MGMYGEDVLDELEGGSGAVALLFGSVMLSVFSLSDRCTRLLTTCTICRDGWRSISVSHCT
jgi:hypothetical protein